MIYIKNLSIKYEFYSSLLTDKCHFEEIIIYTLLGFFVDNARNTANLL